MKSGNYNCIDQQNRGSINVPRDTHTHTQRERERERRGKRTLNFVCLLLFCSLLSKFASSLQHLDLSHNPLITDTGCMHLSSLTLLRSLSLRQCDITDIALTSLVNMVTYLLLWFSSVE